MDKTQIVSYISKSDSVEIPALQMEFGLSYKEAKSVVDELIQKGVLLYDGGVRYKQAQKTTDADSGNEDKEGNDLFIRARREERLTLLRKMQEEDEKRRNDAASEDDIDDDSEECDEEEDSKDSASDESNGNGDLNDVGD
ncbi:MAG: hypothetical protein K2G31_05260, partial [Clostridia bacterium]|nr:hypothetical protein [Clostridia bacterium]